MNYYNAHKASLWNTIFTQVARSFNLLSNIKLYNNSPDLNLDHPQLKEKTSVHTGSLIQV